MADFKLASESVKRDIYNISKYYTYLNGKKHDDGSVGEIKITRKEFEQALYDAYLEGYSEH